MAYASGLAPPPSGIGLAQLAATSLFLVKVRHETAAWCHRFPPARTEVRARRCSHVRYVLAKAGTDQV